MGDEDEGLVLKTSWKRKEDRVNFFAKEATEADFFDLMKAGCQQLSEKTVQSGWLTKCGGTGIKQNWRKRWFVLTYDKILYYYKTPQDTQPTGVIELNIYEAVSIEEKSKRFRFYLHNNNKSNIRVFRLTAPTQMELVQWVAAISQVLKSPVLESSKTKVIRREGNIVLPSGVRRDCRLFIRVVEARELPKYCVNSYCLVGLGKAHQVRTQTVWKAKEPMWSENFHMDVTDPEGALAVTLWRTAEGARDKMVGKLEVHLSSLMDQKQHDQWHTLTAADDKEYMSGEIHIKIEHKTSDKSKPGVLLVQVVKARNLLPKGVNGLANPFLRLSFGKRRAKKTKVVSKSLDPTFNEVFEFKATDPVPKELVVTVWHQDVLKNVFMGQVTIPIAELEPNVLYDAWYMLTNQLASEYALDDDDEDERKLYTTDSASDLIRNSLLGSTESGDSSTSSSSSSSSTTPGSTLLSPRLSSVSHMSLGRTSSSEISPTRLSRAMDGAKWTRGSFPALTELDPILAIMAKEVELERQAREEAARANGTESCLSPRDAEGSATIMAAETTEVPLRDDTKSPLPIEHDLASGSGSSAGSLLASPGSTENMKVGSIRLLLKYTEEIVLPLPQYDALLELLLDEQQEVVEALGDVTTEREEVAMTLCRIFEVKNKAIMMITHATCREIDATENPDVIFRANTLATKALDYYMKLVGLPYLYSTLHAVVKEIYNYKKPFEVDPHRVDKGEDIKKNFQNLLALVQQTTNCIFESTDVCPHKLRHVFHNLQQKVMARYPAEQIEVTKYTAISGFLFLRFFCPSILGPKLFDLMKEHPEMKTARILTLVSKTVQNLSNLCEFGYKEPYMADMNEFITSNLGNMKQFINTISSLPDTPRKEDTPEIDLGRELAMIHRHLINNRAAIEQLKPSSPAIVRLGAVLDKLEQVKSEYIST